ncbi:MAG TPA: hypothetical protein VK177_15715 [Flavobacteriales bacterium]|nr:hypothetical protein [Flavobacteriales bacterium]
MFKLIAAACILFLFSITGNAQPYLHTQQLLKEKKVKSFTRTSTWKDHNKPVTQIQIFDFDEQGRKSKITQNEGEGYTEYQYDEHGNQTRWASITPNGLDEYLNKFTYDEKGRKISDTDLKSTSHQTTHFEYDEKGNMVHSWVADDSGYKYVYDQNNRLIESFMYYKDKKTDRTVYAYQPNGDTIHKILYHKWGMPDTVVTTWEYLPGGEIKKVEKSRKKTTTEVHRKNYAEYVSITQEESGKAEKILQCVYDKNGLLIESIRNERYKAVFTYNEKGLVVNEQVSDLKKGDPDYRHTTYTYTYFE